MSTTANSAKPILLVTNDDGIHSQGIKALIETAILFGDVYVIAPERGWSGKSHSVTMDEPLYLKKSALFEADAKEADNLNGLNRNELHAWTLSGSPVDCIKIGLHEVLLNRPTLILSGINHGQNSSVDVIYSGTMAAAIEGAIHEIPSVGFSLCDYSESLDFSQAKIWIKKLLTTLFENQLPLMCLNVNIPYNQKINGIKIARQSKGRWIEKMDKRKRPAGQPYYWLSGDFHNLEKEATDTDKWAIENGFISVVPVNCDYTYHAQIPKLKTIFY